MLTFHDSLYLCLVFKEFFERRSSAELCLESPGGGGREQWREEWNRTEVPSTLSHPASQQGGRGEVEKSDRRSQGDMVERWGGQGFLGQEREKGKILPTSKL